MSAIRAHTLDECLIFLFSINLDDNPYALAEFDLALTSYEEAIEKAPRLVQAWHHIRMGLRVLTTGKALP